MAVTRGVKTVVNLVKTCYDRAENSSKMSTQVAADAFINKCAPTKVVQLASVLAVTNVRRITVDRAALMLGSIAHNRAGVKHRKRVIQAPRRTRRFYQLIEINCDRARSNGSMFRVNSPEH